MIRIVLAACLSFLLLGLQHETLTHAFQHDGARFAAGGKAVAQPGSDGTCASCALLAGGSHAAVSQGSAHSFAAVLDFALARLQGSRAVAAPVYYASRAPPAPLL